MSPVESGTRSCFKQPRADFTERISRFHALFMYGALEGLKRHVMNLYLSSIVFIFRQLSAVTLRSSCSHAPWKFVPLSRKTSTGVPSPYDKTSQHQYVRIRRERSSPPHHRLVVMMTAMVDMIWIQLIRLLLFEYTVYICTIFHLDRSILWSIN